MTINTTIGKTYAITPTVESTVTTPDGTLIATCPPGEQTLLIAPTTQLIISDPAALVTETFKGASAVSSAAGGVIIHYVPTLQTPPDGAREVYTAEGYACVATASGQLRSLSITTRSSGEIPDTSPLWIKIWNKNTNGTLTLLGTSYNSIIQQHGTNSTWHTPRIPINAGQKLHITCHHTPTTTTPDGRYSAAVVANTLPDTGIIDRYGTISTPTWVPLYAITLENPDGLEAHGIPLAQQANLDTHTQDSTRHITATERTAWNSKADTSALASKVNTSTFNAHTGDTAKHITTEERTAWNAKTDATDFQTLEARVVALEQQNPQPPTE